jgi:hypothetical protein
MLVFFGICPKHIAKQSLVWDVSWPGYHFDISVIRQVLAEAAMHTQYFVVNERCDWQLFKNIDELFEEAAVFLIGSSECEL